MTSRHKPMAPVPAAEYRWTDPSVITRLPEARRPLARMQAHHSALEALPVEGEGEVVPGIYFVSAPRHTPGHTAFHLTSGNAELMISNDAAYVPALCARHPEAPSFRPEWTDGGGLPAQAAR